MQYAGTQALPELYDELDEDKYTLQIECESDLGEMSFDEWDFSDRDLEDVGVFFEESYCATSNVASLAQPNVPVQSNSHAQVPLLPVVESKDEFKAPQEMENGNVENMHMVSTTSYDWSNTFKTFYSSCDCSHPYRQNAEHSTSSLPESERHFRRFDDYTCIGCEAKIIPADNNNLFLIVKSENVGNAVAARVHQRATQSMRKALVPVSQFSTSSEPQTARVLPKGHVLSSKRSLEFINDNITAPTKQRRCLEQREQNPEVIDCKYVQFQDCRSKNSVIGGRHENLECNIVAKCPSNKKYRLLQIVRFKDGHTQLQTPCGCGRYRTFSLRRSIRNHVAITFFKADKCSCDHKQTHPLMMCFCGALFRAEKSLFSCPCFDGMGPALTMHPNFARFAARGCSCPIQPRRCHCLSSTSR